MSEGRASRWLGLPFEVS